MSLKGKHGLAQGSRPNCPSHPILRGEINIHAKNVSQTALQASDAHECEVFGLIKFGQQIDIGAGRRLVASNRPEHAQMHDSCSSKLRFMRSQFRYDLTLIHNAILAHLHP